LRIGALRITEGLEEVKMTRKTGHPIIVAAITAAALIMTMIPAHAASPPDAGLVGMSYNKEQGLAVLSRYELFRSRDGMEWIPAGLMDRSQALSIVVLGKNYVLVGTESGDILRSIEGGPYVNVKKPKDPYGRPVAPIRHMAIHPRGQEVLASSGQGLIRSVDQGATWTPVTDPFYSNPDAREVICIGYAKDDPVIVTRKGAYRKTKDGFELITRGLPKSVRPTVASVFNGEILMALPGEGIYLAKKDSAFKKLKGVPGDPIAFVGFVDNGYLAARPTTALHKGDSKGNKWVPIGVDHSPGFVPRDSLSSPFGDYLILREKGLVRIEGDSFIPVPMPLPLSSINARIKTVWESVIAGTRGGVFYSSAKEQSWEDVTPPDLGVAVNVFLPLEDGRILLGAEGAGVYSSPGSGNEWMKWSRGLGTANTIRGLVQYKGGILAGTENGLMWIDGGTDSTWSTLDGGVGRTSVICLKREADLYVAATHKGIFSARGTDDFRLLDGFKGSAIAVAVSGDRILALVSGKVLLSEKGKKPLELPRLPVRSVVVDVTFRGDVPHAASSKGVFKLDGKNWVQADNRLYPVDRFVKQDKGVAYVTKGAGTFDLP
jgi:hypothetical protein